MSRKCICTILFALAVTGCVSDEKTGGIGNAGVAEQKSQIAPLLEARPVTYTKGKGNKVETGIRAWISDRDHPNIQSVRAARGPVGGLLICGQVKSETESKPAGNLERFAVALSDGGNIEMLMVGETASDGQQVLQVCRENGLES
jgi:hypothetical protein